MDGTTQSARRYEVISGEAEFRALQSEWDALWSNAQGYAYQSFGFCWLAWKYVSKPHGRKLKCIVCREDGKLVLVWPLATIRRLLWRCLVPLGPEGGDLTSVLVEDNELTAELVAGAWDVARKRCGADFIHLSYVREGLELCSLVSRERRVQFAEPYTVSAASLRGQGSWDDYCHTLGTLFHKRPGGFAKKLSKEGTVVVRMLDPAEESETAAVIEWMLKCKRVWSERTGKWSEWLDSREFERFLGKLIYSGEVPSMARLIVVTLDEAPVSAIVVTLGNPCASALIAGFDPHYGKCCPGLITIEQCVKWAFESGYDLDFGVGTEDFKIYWSRGQTSTAWTVRTINTHWGLLAAHARDAVRKLVEHAKAPWQSGAAAPHADEPGSPHAPAIPPHRA